MDQKTIIGSHGGQGSNGTRAFEYAYDTNTHLYKGFQSFDALYEGLISGDVDQIIVPYEGAVTGKSESVHAPLKRAQEKVGGFEEVMAFSIPLYYALVSAKNANVNTIKTVYSHPLVFELCSDMIAQLNLKTIEHTDSYSAAQHVISRGRPDEAAISPIEAAQAFGGQILKDDVANDQHNMMLYKVFRLSRSSN